MSAGPLEIVLPDEAATCRLAAELAPCLRPGDCVALRGDLGAGKTVFARAMIRRFADDPACDVTSPTFTLMQSYATPRGEVAHFDFYRLDSPDEVEELGFDDALANGLVMVEWPERAEHALPADRLEVTLADSGPGRRRALLAGAGAWRDRLCRLQALRAFLREAGWAEAERAYLQGDASARRYERIGDGARRAVVMDLAPGPKRPPVRGTATYNEIAHLAQDVRPFVAMAEGLRAHGFSAPEILAADLDRGFVLVEDLGDAIISRLAGEGADLGETYRAAVDVLLRLHALDLPGHVNSAHAGRYDIPPYDRDALMIEAELVVDWMWPRVKGHAAGERLRAEYTALWDAALAPVLAPPPVWTLRDYHSPNLVWLAGREGIARIGLLDFQDAVMGHPAYDLVSLLQDARVTVASEREQAMLERYCANAAWPGRPFDEEGFRAAYAVLGAQRAAKILGIFVRLAVRDGKQHYLAHLPRVSRLLERNLAHPALEALRDWFARNLPADVRESA